jgi:hypothetical protein
MPLTPDEVVRIGPDAVTLAKTIAGTLATDSPGGKRITRAEARQVLRLLAALLAELVREGVD